jgi:dihydroorotate dehydrogenase (NAD+) catalytic subunit
MKTPDLSTNVCGVHMNNPTVLASGILGLTVELMVRAGRMGAGAITSKSCSLDPRPGHANPVVLDWGPGLINTVGLSNPGIASMAEELRRTKKELVPSGIPLIGSIFGDTVASFEELAGRISEAEPDLIELNISCPNVDDEFGRMFSADAASAASVTRQVKRATDIPVIVKLSPNVPGIETVAQAVEAEGADAISAINTVGPGMVIDVETGMPILSQGRGGLSGPAIRPLAVRCVYDICRSVRIPVIGMGGVCSGLEAVEMMMAGASAVAIGSAVYTRGIEVFRLVCDEMRDFMASHGYQSIEDFRGLTLSRWEP